MKNIRIFYLKNCHCLVVKFSVFLNRRIFVMGGEALKLISVQILEKYFKVPSCNMFIQSIKG